MNHDIKHKIAHGIHAAHNTEAGKKIMHGAVAVGAAVLTPIVGATLAPVVAVGAIGWGLWKLFKK